jgi:hypothetical protein
MKIAPPQMPMVLHESMQPLQPGALDPVGAFAYSPGVIIEGRPYTY